MKKRIFILFLVTMIDTVLCSQRGLAANLVSQCMLNVPNHNRLLLQNKVNKSPVTIIAKNVEENHPDNVTFTGNVNIIQGNSHLQADKVQLHQNFSDRTTEPVRTVNALGNVHYNDNQVILKGQKAWSNLNTKDINVWEGSYQIVGRQGHGKADLIKQRGANRYTILDNGSFTSCLPESNTWSIVGNQVIYDREEQIVKIWDAYFKLGSVPVFYSPYLQLPVGDRKRSGFLIPNVKYSITNYFEFSLPYYWNIAPNMNITITPHYIYKRGNIMWENEFCYLTRVGSGFMELYHLPSDKIFKDKLPIKGNQHRWLYYWQHSGVMDHKWSFNVNYTKVSDSNYFNDFSSKYGSNTNGYVTQMFSIGYATQNSNATISTHQFQVFNGKSVTTYNAKPQLDINWYQNNVGPFDIQVYGQAIHFVNTNFDMPEATRIHLEPSINLLLSNDWLNLNTKIKVIATHYYQKNLDNYNAINNKNLKESVNRVLPQFKVDGKLIFERNMNLVSSHYTQTLEPRIQYLYIPYHDQSKINKYDSSLLQFDYDGLFRDHTYSGLDRIASTNQVAAGLINRIFDNNVVERFNFSIGQIYYFTNLHTGDENTNWKSNKKMDSLVWVSNTYWRITDNWGLRNSVQYNTKLKNFVTSSASAEYNSNEDRMVQLTYRYVSPEYTQVMLDDCITKERYNKGISQLGGVISWSINNRWSAVGAYYFNTNTYHTTDQNLGLQYNSCCYAIRVGYEHKLNGWNINSNHSEYDNIIDFNIELRGLSSNYNLSTQQMLRSNILPYRSSL